MLKRFNPFYCLIIAFVFLLASCSRNSVVKYSYENNDFSVDFKDVVALNDTAQFRFETFEKINQVMILSDGNVLGTAKVVNNKANIKLKFPSVGERKLVFVGQKDDNKQSKKIKGVIMVVAKLITPKAKVKATAKAKVSDAQIFISQITPYIVERCKKNNLPTSVVIAMAALESGYGKSELANNANNFFGLKDWSKDHAQAYQYTKQAYPGEVGNWYKKFNSREECFDFFMEELLMHKTGKWRNDYSPAVKAFQENINQGMDKSLAIEKFVEKLLDLGYSTLPKDQYIARIKRVITNYNLEDL